MPQLAALGSSRNLVKLFAGVVFLLPIFGAGNFPGLLGGAQNQLLWQTLALLTWGFVVMKSTSPLTAPGGSRALWPIWGLLLLLGCALPFSKPFDSAWRQSFELLGGLFLAFCALRLRLAEEERRSALWALFAGLVVAALYGIYQTYLYFPGLAATPGLSAEDQILAAQMTRPFSFFPGVNIFGGFLALALPLGAFLAATSSKKSRLAYLLAGAVILFALLLTYSRGAWLAALFGAFLAAWVFAGKRGRLVLAGLAVLGLVGLSVVLSSPEPLDTLAAQAVDAAAAKGTEARLSSTFSLTARQQYWTTAWRMGTDLFPFGGGLGSYADRARQYQSSTSYTRSPHNVALKLYAELGLLGLALGLWFALTALLAVRRAWGTSRGREAALIGSTLLVLVAHGLIDIDFDSPAPWALFWLLWVLLIAPGLPTAAVDAHPKSKEAEERRSARAILVAALLVPAIVFAQFFPKMSDAYGDLVTTAKKGSSAEKSLELGKLCVSYWPFDPQAHYRLSRLYLERSGVSGQRDDLRLAREEVERAIELDPFSPEITLGYADVLSALGDFERTARVLKHAGELYPASLHYLTQYVRALSFSAKNAGGPVCLGARHRPA